MRLLRHVLCENSVRERKFITVDLAMLVALHGDLVRLAGDSATQAGHFSRPTIASKSAFVQAQKTLPALTDHCSVSLRVVESAA